MSNELLRLINELLRLIKVAQDLDPSCEAYQKTLQEMQKYLPNDSDDCNHILRYLNAKQRPIFFEAIETRLAELICNANDFSNILESLDDNQRQIVFKRKKDELETFIKQDPDTVTVTVNFIHVQRYLNPQQFQEICNINLLSFIKNSHILVSVVSRLLEPKKFEIFCERMKNNFSNLITTSEDLNYVLAFLSSPEHLKIFFTAMQEHLPTLITTSEELKHVLMLLQAGDPKILAQALHIPLTWLQDINKENIKERIDGMLKFNALLNELIEKQYSCKEKKEARDTFVETMKAACTQFTKDQKPETFISAFQEAKKTAKPILSQYKKEGGNDCFFYSRIFIGLTLALSAVLLITIPFIVGAMIYNASQHRHPLSFFNKDKDTDSDTDDSLRILKEMKGCFKKSFEAPCQAIEEKNIVIEEIFLH